VKKYSEKVLRAAREIAVDAQIEWNEHFMPTDKEVRFVAAGILAERERCRRIASEYDSLAAEAIG